MIASRAATLDDAEFLIAAALYTGAAWSRQTVEWMLADPDIVMTVVEQDGIPVAFAQVDRGDGAKGKPGLVKHLGIDPTHLPDKEGKRGERLEVADKALLYLIEHRKPGVTVGAGSVPVGSKIDAYIQTLGVDRQVKGDKATFTIDIDELEGKLKAKSRTDLYESLKPKDKKVR